MTLAVPVALYGGDSSGTAATHPAHPRPTRVMSSFTAVLIGIHDLRLCSVSPQPVAGWVLPTVSGDVSASWADAGKTMVAVPDWKTRYPRKQASATFPTAVAENHKGKQSPKSGGSCDAII